MSVSIITLVASLIGFIVYFVKNSQKLTAMPENITSVWPLVLVGIVMAGLEILIMMIYRSGGQQPISVIT